MKLSKFIFITLVLLSSFGCKKKELPESEFEKDVLNSVFVEIVDSIYMDRRTISPPPIPRIDFKTNQVDTLGYHDKLKKYQFEQDSIKKDTTKILLAVSDLIKKIGRFDKEKVIENCKKLGCVYDKSKESEDLKFDLTPFKSNKKFDFQFLSKFSPINLWDINDKKSLLPVGAVGVSRIQFNKTKTLGVLAANASCGGGTCGRGFLVIIENKTGKWKVNKIIHLWSS